MKTRTAESSPSLARHFLGRYGPSFLAIGVLFLAVVAYQTYTARQTAQAGAATNVNNLALVLESRLNADFASAERTVSRMVDDIDPEAMRQEMVSRYRPKIEHWLKITVKDISSASALRYFDANGDRLYTSVEDEPPVNVADRHHFQLNKSDPANSTIFSEVLLGRATGRISMFVSRAIRARDGAFLGVAAVGFDLTSIHDHFRDIVLGKGGVVALRRLDDGASVVRYPGPVDTDNKSAPDLPVRQAILGGGPVGAMAIKSLIDGTMRLYGYRKIGAYPFFVAVGIADDEYLAQWRRETAFLIVGSALFLSLLLAIFFRLARAELQRSKTENELRDSQNRLTLAADAGDVGMWNLDLVTGTASRSLRHDTIFGYTSPQPTWSIAMFLSHVIPEDRESVERKFQEAPARGKISFECRILRIDQTPRWIRVTGQTFPDEHGNPTRMMGTLIDITESKRADDEIRSLNAELERRVAARTAELNASVADLVIEIAERKRAETSLLTVNHELETFSYSISHDLRTPLRGIAGYARILEENYAAVVDDAGRNMLRRVQGAAQEMGELIEDLLRLSRLTRAVLNVEAVDLSALARAVADKLGAGEPGRNVAFEIQPGLEVRGDRRLLAVALENLLANSWKFTRKHGRARIEVGVTAKDGETAYFVRDDGAGFDMAYAADLFTPFHRMHDEGDFPGNGIGLATVQRIVQRHGGRIWAEAAVGQGATFYFTLST